jgi:anti-anti-sigma factor
MSVHTQVQQDGKEIRIIVDGRFDFGLHNDFRNAYRVHDTPGATYILDLGKTEYIDSSALGMILLLKEHAGTHSASVQIKNVSDEIKNILDIANFDKLFSIS